MYAALGLLESRSARTRSASESLSLFQKNSWLSASRYSGLMTIRLSGTSFHSDDSLARVDVNLVLQPRGMAVAHGLFATIKPCSRPPKTRLYPRRDACAAPILPSDAKLVRRLSLSHSILLLAGGIIGSGIFLTAKDVAINTRHPWLFLTVWVVGMGMALLACFAFAELGGMFPHAGGQYVYMREAYGDTAGFLYGWMYFTVSATGTVAALGVGFATYLNQTFPALHSEHVVFPLRFVDITRGHLIALAAIALQTLINVFGVKKGAILQNVATWAKFGAIAVFVVGGLLLGHGSWDHFRHSLVPAANDHTSIVTGVGIALIAVFWAYDGWVYVTFVGGEIKDPQRNVPRALIWGLLLVGVVYICINAVYVYALPMNEIAAQEAVAQTAAVSMFSGKVAPWLSMMVALSCFGAMAPCLMSGARVYYAMAEDGIFFHALAKVHPRWHRSEEHTSELQSHS